MAQAVLRQATPADMAFAKEVHHEAYRDFVLREWGKWDERQQDAYFNRGWVLERSRIIVYNTAPCGYLTTLNNIDHIFINELALLPQYQHKRIGTEVVERVLGEARREGKSVRVFVLKNNPAHQFYEKLGFRDTTEIENGVHMERKI